MARTKEFDEDTVLLKAMRLFWQRGYEKTSMQELVSHMGVHKRSMYDTFGDKRTLYMKALNRYNDFIGQRLRHKLDNARSSEEAIRLLFEFVIREEDEDPKGCLIVNTAVELSLLDPECKAWVNEKQEWLERTIRELIEAGQQTGEFSKTLDAGALAAYFHNALTGLRVMAKTTDDKEKLHRVIETTMSVLKV
ncbi:TetR/AcrR family transcriptional regulator [Paenibacillus humicola]|uniref:TetR/AcrR family transcriptional regulator n=1 Tax=Paenibacillus humicola TaxID=3110540 RepID=UPI00237C2C02|nr:TetR/AcrR family transcriptional regulator [Paenibacillus humicola]